MERIYNIETKASLRNARDLLLNRGYNQYDELGDESYMGDDLGLILDLKTPSISDIRKYQELFPHGIKFPKSHITTGTTRLFRPNGEDLETLSAVINKEMSEIVNLLRQKHLTDMYVLDYSQGKGDIFLDV